MTANQTKFLIAGIAGVAIYLLGCYTGCKVAPAEVRVVPGAPTTKVLPGKDSIIYRAGTTKYRAGTTKLVHDAVTNTNFSSQVDTVIQVTIMQCPPPDTVVLHSSPAIDPVTILSAFKPQGHTIELWVGGEHDLLGGYGGQASLEVNLQNLGIANVVPFVEIGYLHSPHVAIGVKGPIWGIW